MISLETNLGRTGAGASARGESGAAVDSVDRNAWGRTLETKQSRSTEETTRPAEREVARPEQRPRAEWREIRLREKFEPERRWLSSDELFAERASEVDALPEPPTRTTRPAQDEERDSGGRRHAGESTPLRADNERRGEPAPDAGESRRSEPDARGERAPGDREPATRTSSESRPDAPAESASPGRKIASPGLRSFDIPASQSSESPGRVDRTRAPIEGSPSRATLEAGAASDLKAPDLPRAGAQGGVDASPSPRLDALGKQLVSEKAAADPAPLAQAGDSPRGATPAKPALPGAATTQAPPFTGRSEGALRVEGLRSSLSMAPGPASVGEGPSADPATTLVEGPAAAKGDSRFGTALGQREGGQREGGQQSLSQGAESTQAAARESIVSSSERLPSEPLHASHARPALPPTQAASQQAPQATTPVALASHAPRGNEGAAQACPANASPVTSTILETVERIARLPERSGSVALKVAAGHASEATLHFHRRGDALIVRIVVASEMAAELLHRDLPSLRDTLQGSLSSVDVEVANPESQGQRGNPRGPETPSTPRTSSPAGSERDSLNEAPSVRDAYRAIPQGERLDIRV